MDPLCQESLEVCGHKSNAKRCRQPHVFSTHGPQPGAREGWAEGGVFSRKMKGGRVKGVDSPSAGGQGQ